MDRGLEVIADGGVQHFSSAALLEHAEDGVVRLGALLNPRAPSWVTVSAAEDGYTASIPAGAFLTGAEFHVATSRLTVRDGATLCWNVKGVTSIRIGADKLPDSVPENPSH